jgi:hypothetical protein
MIIRKFPNIRSPHMKKLTGQISPINPKLLSINANYPSFVKK